MASSSSSPIKPSRSVESLHKPRTPKKRLAFSPSSPSNITPLRGYERSPPRRAAFDTESRFWYCPCGKTAALRLLKQGINAGKYFYTCSSFPDKTCSLFMLVEDAEPLQEGIEARNRRNIMGEFSFHTNLWYCSCRPAAEAGCGRSQSTGERYLNCSSGRCGFYRPEHKVCVLQKGMIARNWARSNIPGLASPEELAFEDDDLVKNETGSDHDKSKPYDAAVQQSPSTALRSPSA